MISWRPKADDIDHPYRDFMVIWQDVETQRDVMWSQGSMSGIGILRRDFLEDLQRAYNHIDIRCSDAFKHSGIPDSYRLLLKVCHSRMGALLQRIGKVSSDLMTIKVMVTTAQRFWLEMAAAMDYMDYFRPVMDGLAQKNPCRKSDRLMGAFTTNVDVVQSFCAAGIPVYFVRPLTLFDNQIILKVVPLLRSSSIICELPQCPYPVVFTGAPSDPRKHIAAHKFLKKFQACRDPFNFETVQFLPPPQPPSHGPIRSTPSQKHRHQHSYQKLRAKPSTGTSTLNKYSLIVVPHACFLDSANQTRDKFADLSGEYAPPPIPAWASANTSINRQSIRSLRRVPGKYDNCYYFPDPGLITYANPDRQQTYFSQLDHCFDALQFRASNAALNALPLLPQQWRDVLALSLKRSQSGKAIASNSAKRFSTAEETLGLCMATQGVEVQLVPPTRGPLDGPFDSQRGKAMVWQLCELNFRFELLALDARLTSAPPPKPGEDSEDLHSNFRLNRQECIMRVFPESSLSLAEPALANLGLSAADWTTRYERLQALREVMARWCVNIPDDATGVLGMHTSEEMGLRIEKALAGHYAQTFYDYFGRPPILPRSLEQA